MMAETRDVVVPIIGRRGGCRTVVGSVLMDADDANRLPSSINYRHEYASVTLSDRTQMSLHKWIMGELPPGMHRRDHIDGGTSGL